MSYQERDFSSLQFKDFLLTLTTVDTKMTELFKQLKEAYQLKIFIVSNEAKEFYAYRIYKI